MREQDSQGRGDELRSKPAARDAGPTGEILPLPSSPRACARRHDFSPWGARVEFELPHSTEVVAYHHRILDVADRLVEHAEPFGSLHEDRVAVSFGIVDDSPESRALVEKVARRIANALAAPGQTLPYEVTIAYSELAATYLETGDVPMPAQPDLRLAEPPPE